MALLVITLFLVIVIAYQTLVQNEGFRSRYSGILDSPWKSGIYRSRYPYGGFSSTNYPIYGTYLDLNYPSKKYAAPHWYSSVTLAQQGLAGIPYYDYYHDYY